MSEENDEESLEELAKRKLQKDLGKKDTDESPDDIKAERDTLRAQLSTLALKEWEQQVESTLAKIPEGKRDKIREQIQKSGDQPATLESIKAQIAMNEESEDDGTEAIPPVGVVKAPPKIQKESIADLYQILDSRSSSSAEKAVANKRLDELWRGLQTKRKRQTKDVLNRNEVEMGEEPSGE